MFHQVLAELRSGRLIPQDKEAKLRLAALICQALSNTPVWEFYTSWAEILGTADSGHVIASLHKEMEVCIIIYFIINLCFIKYYIN